jgi:NAD(P)-dependent dehydrogenase (short-subunit alcohol dehydrogenase family)
MAPRGARRLEQTPPARLDGQVAPVTGAGRGIGRAIALALSEAGAAVAVCARSQGEIDAVTGQIAEGSPSALGDSRIATGRRNQTMVTHGKIP